MRDSPPVFGVALISSLFDITLFPPGDQTHVATEQTVVPMPRVRTEGQQVNGIIEDRSSVSSTDMLVRQWDIRDLRTSHTCCCPLTMQFLPDRMPRPCRGPTAPPASRTSCRKTPSWFSVRFASSP